jgi:hypothetical protein
MNDSAQQPRAQRFPLMVPIHYRKSGISNWHDGRTVNISHTGVLFQTDENLQNDLKLEIRISLSPKTTLACQGTVVRIEPTVSTAEKTGLAARISHYRLLSPDKLQETPG